MGDVGSVVKPLACRMRRAFRVAAALLTLSLAPVAAAQCPSHWFWTGAELRLPYEILGFAAADFDGDGVTDLATGEREAPEDISIRRGLGLGQFGPPVRTGVGIAPSMVFARDISGDGRPDVVSAAAGSNFISVLHNVGGSLVLRGTAITAIGLMAMVSEDFNADGRPDFAVISSSSNFIGVHFGTPNGLLSTPTNLNIGSRPGGLVSGDFNRDGRPDLAYFRVLAGDISVRLSTGPGTFGPVRSVPLAVSPLSSLFSLDFDGDGNLDLVCMHESPSKISMVRGNGDGTFQSAVAVSTIMNAGNAVVADLNVDGRDEIVTGGSRLIIGDMPTGVSVQTRENFSLSGESVSVIGVADFTGDGLPEVVASKPLGSSTTILRNRGGSPAGPSFVGESFSSSWLPTTAVADFNVDGLLDIAVLLLVNKSVQTHLGRPEGGFSALTPQFLVQALVSVPPRFTAHDFSGDGLPDILMNRMYGNERPHLLVGRGDGTFQAPVPMLEPQHLGRYLLGDFDGNGTVDLVSPAPGTRLAVYSGASDGTLSAPVEWPISFTLALTAVADFDRDGRSDIVSIGHSTGNNIAVHRASAAGGFDPAILTPLSFTPWRLASADFDGDLLPDVVTIDSSGRGVSVFRGLGNGAFLTPVSYDMGATLSDVAAGSVRKPGMIDIFSFTGSVSHVPDQITVLPNLGNGLFGQPRHTPMNESYYWISTADFDRDGSNDLLARTRFSSTIFTFSATGPGFVQGDADASRRVDFEDVATVLMNFGTTSSRPISGDADANGLVNFYDITTILSNFGTDCR